MPILDMLRMVFRGGTGNFTEFERAILSGVESALPADLRERFRKRVNAVNLVQRLDGGREVNCFVMKNGKATLDPSTRLSSVGGEQLLAKVAVKGGVGTKNVAQLWLVEGNFFSLEFEDPTEHASASEVERISVQVCKLEVAPAGTDERAPLTDRSG